MNPTHHSCLTPRERRFALASLLVLTAIGCGTPRTLRAPLASDPVPRCLAEFVQPRFDVREQPASAEHAVQAIRLTLAGNRALSAGNCLEAAARFEAARGLSPQHPAVEDVARFRQLCRPCEKPVMTATLAAR